MQEIIHVGKWSQKIEITDGRKQEKKIISYFNYAVKQYTISVLETRSKHTPQAARF